MPNKLKPCRCPDVNRYWISQSNNCVCWGCKKSKRWIVGTPIPICTSCGKTMKNIGKRWNIPPANHTAKWKRLKILIAEKGN